MAWIEQILHSVPAHEQIDALLLPGEVITLQVQVEVARLDAGLFAHLLGKGDFPSRMLCGDSGWGIAGADFDDQGVLLLQRVQKLDCISQVAMPVFGFHKITSSVHEDAVRMGILDPLHLLIRAVAVISADEQFLEQWQWHLPPLLVAIPLRVVAKDLHHEGFAIGQVVAVWWESHETTSLSSGPSSPNGSPST